MSANPHASEPPAGLSGLAHRLMVEMGPLLVFFLVSMAAGIETGTGALMAATALATGLSVFHERRLPVLPLAGLAFTLLFGGLTVALGEPAFIEVRPTAYNGLAGAILVGALLRGRLLLKAIFGPGLPLPDRAWRSLTWRTIAFLFALAALNEAVWRGMTTEQWVTFKAFVVPPLNLLFLAANWKAVQRWRRPEEPLPGASAPCPEATPAGPGR